MAKFYGIIGFAVSEETRPGVWTESVKERTYRGDLTRTASRWEGTETLNDNVNITNQISIVADPLPTSISQLSVTLNFSEHTGKSTILIFPIRD